jgi:hypothetical protein
MENLLAVSLSAMLSSHQQLLALIAMNLVTVTVARQAALSIAQDTATGSWHATSTPLFPFH